MAASATFALKSGEWFRRVRFVIFAPDSHAQPCALSGRDSTHRTDRNCGATSSNFGEQSPLFSKRFPKTNAKLISQTRATPNLIEKCSRRRVNPAPNRLGTRQTRVRWIYALLPTDPPVAKRRLHWVSREATHDTNGAAGQTVDVVPDGPDQMAGVVASQQSLQSGSLEPAEKCAIPDFLPTTPLAVPGEVFQMLGLRMHDVEMG